MTQHFGSALVCPWALVMWNAGSSAGRRPATTVAYITDDCGDHYLGGLVEFYRKRSTVKAVRDEAGKIVRYDTATEGDGMPLWHFRFTRERRILKGNVVSFFPNGKSRQDGPTKAQIAAAKRAVPKTPSDPIEP
jgi:hypothetical protein